MGMEHVSRELEAAISSRMRDRRVISLCRLSSLHRSRHLALSPSRPPRWGSRRVIFRFASMSELLWHRGCGTDYSPPPSLSTR